AQVHERLVHRIDALACAGAVEQGWPVGSDGQGGKVGGRPGAVGSCRRHQSSTVLIRERTSAIISSGISSRPWASRAWAATAARIASSVSRRYSSVHPG